MHTYLSKIKDEDIIVTGVLFTPNIALTLRNKKIIHIRYINKSTPYISINMLQNLLNAYYYKTHLHRAFYFRAEKLELINDRYVVVPNIYIRSSNSTFLKTDLDLIFKGKAVVIYRGPNLYAANIDSQMYLITESSAKRLIKTEDI